MKIHYLTCNTVFKMDLDIIQAVPTQYKVVTIGINNDFDKIRFRG
jgi:hypothetical protein